MTREPKAMNEEVMIKEMKDESIEKLEKGERGRRREEEGY